MKDRKRRGRLISRIIKNLFHEQECGGCPKWLRTGDVVVQDRADETLYCSPGCAARTIKATKGVAV